MAVATYERQEVYAQSQEILYEMGRFTVCSAFEEAERKEAEAYTNFYTRVGEHIKTDREFRHELDIVHVDRFEITDGKVVSKDGTPIVDLVEGGLRASNKAAVADARMEVQVFRDEGDVEVAKTVELLQPGESLRVVSMDPKLELARDKKFWEAQNYREGIAYVQMYYKLPDSSAVLAGAYSVDHSDADAWRRVQGRDGIYIPESASPNEWIRYGKREHMTQTEALQKPLSWREEYYREVGKNHRRVSLNEYLELQKDTIDIYFGAYIKPLSEAIFTGKNKIELQQFAQTILQTVDKSKLHPKKLEEIMQIALNDRFTEENGRVMEECICYAVVEDLRVGLEEFISDNQRAEHAQDYTLPAQYSAIDISAEQLRLINLQAASRINTGVSSGRSYGGCSGVGLGIDDEKQNTSSQDIHGGKIEEEGSVKPEKGVMRCVNCPKCRTYHHELKAKSGVFKCKNDKCGHTAPAS